MNAGQVTVSLTVQEEGSDWIAEVVFSNGGADPFPLYRPNLPDGGKLANNVFVITANGARVKYRGVYAKRRAPVAEDFVMLAPGAKLSGKADLSAAYDLPATGQWHVRYEAYHGDVTLFGDIWELRSAEVVVR